MTDPPVPLARLLAMSYRWMIDELHRRLAADGWRGIRPAYGFMLLAVRPGPITPTELATQLGVTKQAASKLADAMITDKLLDRDVDDDDARRRRITLAPRGLELLAAVEAIYAALEDEWADIVGATSIRQTKQRLSRALLAVHDGAFPPIRPTP
ncbi:MAG: MarR family transcriptional regulator [Acidimicrobiia bacterium]|nr:MarR family transcriptional regulator [Acidimicrobiia bacterium]